MASTSTLRKNGNGSGQSGDVMLDLETWGTMPGSALRSIGAITFDPYGNDGFVEASFYRNIDHVSCERAGLKV